MGHCLETGRGDGERERNGPAEDGGGSVDAGDVDQDAWSQAVFGKGGGVFVDGDLVRRAGVVEFW